MLERLQKDVERKREDARRLAGGGTPPTRAKPPTVDVPPQGPTCLTCGGRLVPRRQGGVVNAVCFGCGAEYGELPEATLVPAPAEQERNRSDIHQAISFVVLLATAVFLVWWAVSGFPFPGNSWEEQHADLIEQNQQIGIQHRQGETLDAYNQRVNEYNQRVFDQNQRAIDQNKYWQQQFDSQMNQLYGGPYQDRGPYRHELPPN